MSIHNEIKEMILDLQNENIEALENKYQNYFYKNKPLITKDMDGISGLWYIQDYLTTAEIEMFNKKLSNDEIELESISTKQNSRRVAHYGYYYSYDKTGLKPAPAIPDYLEKLADVERINKILRFDLIKKPFEQVIINEYKPCQEINYHTDHKVLFGSIIACITVGQSVPIKFKFGDEIKTINIDAGSMYIMTGDARNIWQHYLKNNGKNTRYSITYRTINK